MGALDTLTRELRAIAADIVRSQRGDDEFFPVLVTTTSTGRFWALEMGPEFMGLHDNDAFFSHALTGLVEQSACGAAGIVRSVWEAELDPKNEILARRAKIHGVRSLPRAKSYLQYEATTSILHRVGRARLHRREQTHCLGVWHECMLPMPDGRWMQAIARGVLPFGTKEQRAERSAG